MIEKPSYEELEQRIRELEKVESDRNQSDELLHESEEKLRLIFHTSPDSINLNRVSDGMYLDINAGFTHIMGYTREDVIGKTSISLNIWKNPSDRERLIDSLLKTGIVDNFETQFVAKDGNIKVGLMSARIMRINHEDVTLSVTRDVTDKKRTEEVLRASEERLKIISENMSDTVWLMDMNFKTTYVSPSVTRKLGYTFEEYQELTLEKNFSPASMKIVSQVLEEELTTERLAQKDLKIERTLELEICRKDGSRFWNEITMTLIRDLDGNPIGFVGVGRDITERKRVVEELRESEEKYRLLVQHAPAGIYEYDIEKARFISVNEVMCEYTGYTREEFMALDPFELLAEESKKQFLQLIEEVFSGNQNPEPVEYKIKGKNNREFWVFVNARFFFENGKPKRATAVAHDITALRRAEEEKKQLEAKLRRAQKLESIGTLAGGIAHDFNNILSSVIGFTELSLDEVENETVLKENLQEVYAAGIRAKDLVRQILTFARQSDEELKPIHIDTIAKEVIKFIRSSIPTTIEIEHHIESHSPIMGNSTQVHQILMNLCTNAAYAMQDRGGILELTLKDVVIDGASTPNNSGLKPGSYIEIKVSDTGTGIPAEIIDSIFTPYFTTKPPGEGTGMGLSMVHGIVESYAGRITVESEMEKGSIFKIYLPICKQKAKNHQYESRESPSGNERILYIDDEIPIVKMGGQFLERLGYSVTTRTSSVEALELFRSKLNDFDLVITDRTMPNITGDKLAIELMKIRPDIPIILCTGYGIQTPDVSNIGIKAIAYKPIVMTDLAKTVRDVLDAAK
jgi:PAS domain S-box-containing protein